MNPSHFQQFEKNGESLGNTQPLRDPELVSDVYTHLSSVAGQHAPATQHILFLSAHSTVSLSQAQTPLVTSGHLS